MFLFCSDTPDGCVSECERHQSLGGNSCHNDACPPCEMTRHRNFFGIPICMGLCVGDIGRECSVSSLHRNGAHTAGTSPLLGGISILQKSV